MNAEQNRIKKLLKPLFDDGEERMKPASKTALTKFRKRAESHGVPNDVIEELENFYEVTNGVPCIDSFSFHACDDEILFEWWEDDKALWLAQRDMDTLRWIKGKYCLGDASNISYGRKYKHKTLVGLLEASYKEWNGE